MHYIRLVLLLTAISVISTMTAARSHAQEQDAIRYTVLGDSLTLNYAFYYADLLEEEMRAPVDLTFLGVPGASSTMLLDALRNDDAMRASVTDADIVTWNIGVNDLMGARALYYASACGGADNQECFREKVATLQSNWDAITAELLELTGGDAGMLRTMDIYYSLTTLDQPSGDDVVIHSYWRAANEHMRQSAADNGIRIAEVYEEFNGADGTFDPYRRGLIHEDRLHLSALGGMTVAGLLAGLGHDTIGPDTDRDGWADFADNCPDTPNVDQSNVDADYVDLSEYGKSYADKTWVNSDDMGDVCDDDADNDGLSNSVEESLPGSLCPTASAPTDPLRIDTDGDSVVDRAECLLGSDPAVRASVPSMVGDLDRDGLDNGREISLGTHPYFADTDGDGVLDGVEVKAVGSDPLSSDTDHDGCFDSKEMASVNADRAVNIMDMMEIMRLAGALRGTARYIPAHDVTRDGAINVIDLYYTKRQMGVCP